MRAFVPLLLLATSALTACGNSEDSKVTEQRMDDVDSVAGTISDDMPDTDENVDEAMVDAAPPPEAGKPAVKPTDAKVADKPIDEKTIVPAATPPAPAPTGNDAD